MSVKNLGASIRYRLLNKARVEKLDFNLLLTRYALERFKLLRAARRPRLPRTSDTAPAPAGGFLSTFHCITVLHGLHLHHVHRRAIRHLQGLA